MKFMKYKCVGREEIDWVFDEVEFGKLNLIVGDTATGKTRFLNTIFNLGSFVASNQYRRGEWEVTLEVTDAQYRWKISTDERDKQKKSVIEEKLWIIKDNTEKKIVNRSNSEFYFNNKKLPKLNPRMTSISILKEEEVIKPIYEGFEHIMRRKFFQDELAKASELIILDPQLINKHKRNKSLDVLYKENFSLNAKLHIITKCYPEIFNKICNNMKEIFPFIKETAMKDFSKVSKSISTSMNIPVFCIKENNSNEWIPVNELSSGMQKVLLVISDILTLPNGSIYILDEYENSLGVTAIDFFPSFISNIENDIQFFVTSHHPYLINQISPKDWFVFHRKGKIVSIKYGQELAEKFGKSKQKAFIQLINDPFYKEGVE